MSVGSMPKGGVGNSLEFLVAGEGGGLGSSKPDPI